MHWLIVKTNYRVVGHQSQEKTKMKINNLLKLNCILINILNLEIRILKSA